MVDKTIKPNIILIGMPGAGKSTIGVLLAKHLGMDFCDTDLLVQNRYGEHLSDMIATCGKDGFIRAENEVLRNWHGDCTVVSTGGSAVYSAEAMLKFKESGWTVFIDVPLHELRHRLARPDMRGIAADPSQSLASLYDERLPLYKLYADYTITWRDGMTMESMVSAISGAAKVYVDAGCMKLGFECRNDG